MVVLQFADPNSETQAYSEELMAPEPLHKSLPQTTDHTRVVVSCTIDRTGNLKDLKIVDGKSTALAAKILPALETWRFRPVLRGEKPVEVTAILGFNIDTR
jgi:TonB family protein